jgi:hypothetical protein
MVTMEKNQNQNIRSVKNVKDRNHCIPLHTCMGIQNGSGIVENCMES